MKSHRVKDLMVPLSECATIVESTTLLEAVKVLRQDPARIDPTRCEALLVLDEKQRFVGKLSTHNAIEALEPNYKNMRRSAEDGSIHRFGFNDAFVKSTLEQYHLWERALENLCEKAMHLRVKEVMVTPVTGEFVHQNATRDEAIHRMILGHRHTLLVTADPDAQNIVGILRLADVFEFVADAMQKCEWS